MKINGSIGQPQQRPCHQSFLWARQGQRQLYSPGLRPTRMEGGRCPAFSKRWVPGTTAIFWRRRNKISLAASGDRQDCQWDEEMPKRNPEPLGEISWELLLWDLRLPCAHFCHLSKLGSPRRFSSSLSDVSHLLQLLPCEAGATSFSPALGPRMHLQTVKPNFTPTLGLRKCPLLVYLPAYDFLSFGHPSLEHCEGDGQTEYICSCSCALHKTA